MSTVSSVKNSLIDKILAITNKDFLIALDSLISSSESAELVELTDEQRLMLQMSDIDINNNDIIAHDQVDKEDKEWLKNL